MPVCPTCGEDSGEAAFCPHDGTPLSHVGKGLANMPVVGDVVDGRYRIDEKLGRGGMAVVFRAHSAALGRDVALKVLFPRWAEDRKTVARFAREARATSRIDHPNVIRVFDFGYAEAGFYFLTMELLAGRPLEDLVQESAPLRPARAMRLLLEIADGMARAHELGVIHRDLKPDNVMVDTSAGIERVTIVDFGLSKIEEGSTALLTGEGDVIGTPDFMAPEQWQGRNVDARADVYAFGIMAYEMLSGQLPYGGDNLIQKLQQHLYAIPLALADHPGLAELPAGLSDLVMRCMAKDPLDRPAHMGQVLARLAAIEEASRQASAEPTKLGLPMIAPQATQIVQLDAIRPMGRLELLNELARLERVRQGRLVELVPRVFAGPVPARIASELEALEASEAALEAAEQELALAEAALKEAQRAHRTREAELRARLVEANLTLAVARHALPGELTNPQAALPADTIAMSPSDSVPPAADDGELGSAQAMVERAERRLAALVREPDPAILESEARFERACGAREAARPALAARYAELERLLRLTPGGDPSAFDELRAIDAMADALSIRLAAQPTG